MDVEIIQGFLEENPEARSRAFNYFEQLKESEDSWKLSIDCLTNCTEKKDQVKFFCFQLISHYVKTKYRFADPSQQQIIRKFVTHWIQTQCVEPDGVVVQNKAAQIVCMVFLSDYPGRWPTFFEDLLGTLHFGVTALYIYLRILQAINSEIADREVPRTQKEQDSCTLIKDTMRETCIPKLVDTWHHILVTYESSNPELVCLCLDVMGSFVAWIDIGLIANDRFVLLFVRFLSEPEIREATCDCINQIVAKGMEPVPKIKLVESYVVVLEQAGVLNFTGIPDDEDFMVKLATLVNGMGVALLSSWTRLQKAKDAVGMSIAVNAIGMKTELLLKFLSNEDDEVSQAVIEFAREYLQFLKYKVTAGAYGIPDSKSVEAILCIVINKYKYDKDTNFNSHGREEADFEEYRKSLKVIFDNLAMLDLSLVFGHVKRMITETLNRWQTLPFEDIEVAITFLYLLGEAVPNNQSSSGEYKMEMMQMLHLLVTSGVSRQGHVAVTLQYFETVVRFEKFFSQEPQLIPEILGAFLDERGLRNEDLHVKSRASYLFSRFIKCLKSQVANYTEEILSRLQELLVLGPPDNDYAPDALSPDDQLYLYETVAILIISGHFKPEMKRAALESLLTPVAEKFETLLQKLPLIADQRQRREVAKCMNHAIAVTSRTSKAFSNQQTMKSCGCVDIYLRALRVFLGALNLPYEQSVLQSAVKQYLHRMVVCLESEVLPYIPVAAEQLLKSSDPRSIQEFIPLLNQMISKFKKDIVPFVQQIFLPLVNAIFGALSQPVEDQNERQLLQRSYFLFIAAILTHDITEVIASQDSQNFERILLTVIQGAVEFPDPVAQKTCFSILKKMVELWGGREDFVDFIYRRIVPCCFMAPLRETFDLADAQTVLALSESAACLRSVLEKRGEEEFVRFLQTQYLPTLNLSPARIQEYCQALRSDPKAFKNYLKFFFQNGRT